MSLKCGQIRAKAISLNGNSKLKKVTNFSMYYYA